jgi:hypothetical protein
MPAPRWDRMLETCCRRDASDLLLVPGSPPMIRQEWPSLPEPGPQVEQAKQLCSMWRTLHTKPLTADDLAVLASQVIDGKRDGEQDGYAYSDFWYGNLAFFRVMAFGFPRTTSLSRIPPTRPSPVDPLGSNGGQ